MTNNINTTTTTLTGTTAVPTPVPKPAFIVIYYSSKETSDSVPIIQELLTKAAWDHGFTVIDTAYHPDFPDEYMLKFLIADLNKQIQTYPEKITVITNNFEGVNSNIPDHQWKLSFLIKNKIIDAYQGDIEVNLHKIELEVEHV